MFSSLALRNYRLFWVGGLVSNTGTWMARVAQDWLVLTILTNNSAMALGLITGLQFLPTLASPWAGALADRIPKRRLLLVSQGALALTGAALAILVIGGWITLWQVYLLAFLQGVAAAVDTPARQAFAPEMVPPRLIGNAVGLNSTSFHAARLVGPAVAGLSIAWWGVGPALAVNAASFVTVLIALMLMNPTELHPAPRVRDSGGVRAGLAYVRRRPDIMLVMFMMFMLGTFGLNFQLTNAVMATSVFHVGPTMFGYMGSVMAIGSLAAGLIAAKRTHAPLRLIITALAGFSAVSLGMALAPDIAIYLVLLAAAGFTSLTAMTSANTSVQLSTDPQMRGRVMALYMAIFMGGTPLGSPLVGWIGDAWGPRWTIAIGAIACGVTVLVAGLYLVRRNGWEWPWHRASEDMSFVALPEDVA
ncbi:MAG TPA: MFS transporter [Propionibacteriaceae bacterium]|nr:MFS transporter [Propionibacteriaceae bacterium]